MTDLLNATVLLTGATGRFGWQLSKLLLDAGSRLILTDLDHDLLIETAAVLRSDHRESPGEIIGYFAADLRSVEGSKRVYQMVTELDEQIDILINNAAVKAIREPHAVRPENWEEMMQINLLTPMRLVHLFAPGMVERQQGHIVHTASLAGSAGAPGLARHTSTKFDMRGLSDSLGLELSDYNVRVTTVHPDFGLAPSIVSRSESNDHRASDTEKMMATVVEAIQKNKPEVFSDDKGKNVHFMARFLPNIVWRKSHNKNKHNY